MQVSLFHYLFLIQINRESIIPNDPSTVAATDAPAATLSGANDGRTTRPNNKKNTSQNSKGNRPGHYINSHSLRNAVTRRVQAISERNELVWNANIILLLNMSNYNWPYLIHSSLSWPSQGLHENDLQG